MKFNEFLRKNTNIIESSTSKKVSKSIQYTTERDQFYSGELFQKYDLVESDGKHYRVLEQCSNYFQVVDEAGVVSRKFASALALNEDINLPLHTTEPLSFHGYKPSPAFQQSAAVPAFVDTIEKVASGDIIDDIAVLKAIKAVDEMIKHINYAIDAHETVDVENFNAHVMSHFAVARDALSKIGEFQHHEDYLQSLLSTLQVGEVPNEPVTEEYKQKDKMVVAKIIADAVGLAHDKATSADILVSQAIQKAKRDPKLMKNKEVLQNMIHIAKSVGIKINDSTFDSVTEAEVVRDVQKITFSSLKDRLPDRLSSTALPHGHTMNPSSETHRKQIIKKLRGI